MRTSILSRSVIAVATLAIGSVALAATPATAASASGVTRDQVLTVTNGIRTLLASETQTQPSPAVGRALRAIVHAGCDVSTADDEYAYLNEGVQITAAAGNADGLLLTANVEGPFVGQRECTIAVFASTAPGFQLSGTATVSGKKDVYNETEENYTTTNVTLQTAALSGDVFITAPIDLDSDQYDDVYDVTASAAGNSTKTTDVVSNTKVKDKKTKSEKKAAKVKYDKRIKAAKKSYAKALDKAGSSKSKKAAAKKAYKAKRASAKAKYTYAIAGFKNVKKTTKVTENRPFSVVTVPLFNDNDNDSLQRLFK